MVAALGWRRMIPSPRFPSWSAPPTVAWTTVPPSIEPLRVWRPAAASVSAQLVRSMAEAVVPSGHPFVSAVCPRGVGQGGHDQHVAG